MAGGLVQIVVYGGQDIFLTSNPQITFFKTLFRRHTNFAIEPITQHFMGTANFGQELTSTVDKVGHLMYKTYLEITLPSVDLAKNPSVYGITREKAKEDFERTNLYYQLVYDYIMANTAIIRKLNMLAQTNNIGQADIIRTMNNKDFLEKITHQHTKLVDYMVQHNLLHVNKIATFDIRFLFKNFVKNNTNLSDNEFRQKLHALINNSIYQQMQEFYMVAYKSYLSAEQTYKSILNNTYNERYNFAWVEEIGNAIIDYVEIKIGSQIIDRQTGEWLIIFNKLNGSEAQRLNYNKMVGNVDELITFDDSVKNSYQLLIPFQFWFCRHAGQAIPLVALQYHDVSFTIKLKDLADVCYVENDPILGPMANIQSKYDINLINAQLYIEYIFLDQDEYRRFAQSSHEYLIEVTQFQSYDNIAGDFFSASLNFKHPTKYIVWFAQPNFYRGNPTGHNKCQWNNFGTHIDKSGQTLESTYIRLNNYNRFDKNIDITYYNYIQPYLYFPHSPDDGLYVYSFAIIPTEQQPSAALNLSCIDDFSIISKFTNSLVDLVNNTKIDAVDQTIYMAVYAVSYNILRFFGGMGGLAFP